MEGLRGGKMKFNDKKKVIISRIIIVVLVLAMIIPTLLAML